MAKSSIQDAFQYVSNFVVNHWETCPWNQYLTDEQTIMIIIAIYFFDNRSAIAANVQFGNSRCSFLASTQRIVCFFDGHRSWAKSGTPLNEHITLQQDIANIYACMVMAFLKALYL